LKVFRVVKISLVVLVAALAAAGIVLYVEASRLPGNYGPARLSAEEKEETASEFYRRIFDFGNKAQIPDPFTWSLTQEEANQYLASMDEIAGKGGKAGVVYKAMNDIGLADPALEFHDNTITLMVRAKDYNKVISADIAFEPVGEDKFRVLLRGVRIGDLAIPQSLIHDWLARQQKKLASELQAMPSGAGALSPAGEPSLDEVAKVLATVVAAINEQPVSRDLVWPVQKKRVRIESVEITHGQLTLHVVPILRDGGARRHEGERGRP
jgi:hypothetical protein